MSIVIVSMLSYTSGETIAKKTASQLGYKCVGEEVFEDASQRSGIPPEKIRKAFFEAPSLLGMSSAVRKRCVAHVQAALCAHLLGGNVVFCGPYGHFSIKGVSHVLNVRITASKEDRIALKAKSEGCNLRDAEKAISRDDKNRLAIAKELFGVDDDDESFNLVIDTSRTDVESAVKSIADAVSQERYKPMTYSLQCMKDLELSCRIRASLVDLDPDISVQAGKGDVRIRTVVSGRAKEKRLAEIRRRTEGQEGVAKAEIEAVTDLVDLIDKRLR